MLKRIGRPVLQPNFVSDETEHVEQEAGMYNVIPVFGVLFFQAQLRASVFLTLEEECTEKNIPLVNEKSRQMLSSPNGKLAASLIQDFLQCLGLDCTLAVFNPESKSTVSDPPSSNREYLEQRLGLKPNGQRGDNYPFLLHLIEDTLRGQVRKDNANNLFESSQSKVSNGISNGDETNEATHDATESGSADAPSKANSLDNERVSLNGINCYSQDRELEDPEKLEGVSTGIASIPPSSIHSLENTSEKEESSSPLLNGSSSQSEKDTLAGLEKEYEEEDFSSLSNVNNLPQEESVASNRDNEEDGHKNVSPSDHKKISAKVSENENSASEEIEEDLEDLLSSNSEVSNMTKDLTVSKEDQVADYQESL